jgi:DNA-binding CsgD family transcriptional regulator/GAF domain-containing protein
MGRLTETDLVALGDFAEALPQGDDPRAFGAAVLESLRALVPCDSVTYNEVDLRRHRTYCIVTPGDALDGGDAEVFERYIGQHPVISYSTSTGDGRAHAISDFLTRPQLHRTDLWNGYFRTVGVEHQIAICLVLEPGLVVGIALNRAEPDFDDRDRDLLDLARPLVAASYRAARQVAHEREVVAAFDAALGRDGQGVIACRGDGRVLATTMVADRLLAVHLDARAVPGRRLPARLAELLERPSGLRRGAFFDGRGARLRVRRVAHDEHELLVLDEVPYTVPSATSAGITDRESQILELLCAGRSIGEVAGELGIRPRTVDKHLEHIRVKLNVSSRSAAVARWLMS